MEGADALGLIAEVGIAIVGFAGVIAALRAPSGGVGAYAAMRIGILLGMSGTVVLLALLPFALHFSGLGVGTIWAVSSSAMVMMLVLNALLLRRVGKTAMRLRPPRTVQSGGPRMNWDAIGAIAELLGASG